MADAHPALARARQLQARGVHLEAIATQLAEAGFAPPDEHGWSGAAVARLLVRASLDVATERQERQRLRPRKGRLG